MALQKDKKVYPEAMEVTGNESEELNKARYAGIF